MSQSGIIQKSQSTASPYYSTVIPVNPGSKLPPGISTNRRAHSASQARERDNAARKQAVCKLKE